MSTIRAIVTGASSGIGRATVAALIDAQIEVVAASRSIEKLRELEPRCSVHLCDVTSESSCLRLIESASKDRDRTPVLINAAGTAWFGPFADGEKQGEEWSQIHTNL